MLKQPAHKIQYSVKQSALIVFKINLVTDTWKYGTAQRPTTYPKQDYPFHLIDLLWSGKHQRNTTNNTNPKIKQFCFSTSTIICGMLQL